MLLIVLILSFLVGYLCVAALRPRTDRWQGHDLFWSVLIGLGVTSWAAQALADLGWFSLGAILGLLGGTIALLIVWLRGHVLPRRLHLEWRELAALGAVLALGAALFMQPTTIPLGSRDDGTRLLSGIVAARTGGWLAHMPIPDQLPRVPGLANDIKYVGIEEWDATRDLSVLQFTGAYEAWQAIAHGWADHDRAAPLDLAQAHPWHFWLNPIFALIALGACYGLGRLVFGMRAAMIGTLLLAINLAQVWYARQTMSEVLLQALLLGGTAAAVAYVRAPDRVTAFATGLLLGVALLTKVDALIALAMLGAISFVVWPRRQHWPHLAWLIVPLVLAVAHYAAHSIWFSWTYFAYNLAGLAGDVSFLITLAGAGGIAGGLLALRFQPRIRAAIDHLLTRPIDRRWRTLMIAALLGLTAYAYFIRPTALAQEGYLHPLWQERIFTYRGLSLVMLAAYLTPLGLGLALIGLARWVWRDARWDHLPFLGIALGYALIFTYNPMISGDQPFWVRRFLPVVIPAALLLAGSVIAALWRIRSGWRWLSPVLLGAALGWSIWQTAPVAAIERTALSSQLATIAAAIPPNAVVLFQDWEAAFSLAAPLDLIYERESYQLNGRPYSDEAAQPWRAQISEWQRVGRPIVYIATDGRLTLPPTDLDWQPLAQATLQYHTIETTQGRLPRGTAESTQQLFLYTLEAEQPAAIGCSAEFEIGGDDYGAIGAGFYQSEDLPAQQVRWSKPEAAIVLPELSGTSDILVTVTADDTRPAEAGPATLRWRIDDQLIESEPVVAGWHTYEVRIPAALLAEPDPDLLTIAIDGWSPYQFGQPDARELGLLVDKFTARRDGCRQ